MKPYWSNGIATLYKADARSIPLPDKSVHMVVTSPPYWGLRDYGLDLGIGLEPTLAEWVENIVAVMREVRRVLRDDGVVFLNLGDAYWGSGKGMNGDGTHSDGPKQFTNLGSIGLPVHGGSELKQKDLMGQPWRVAFALQDDGWYLRKDIIWHKPNPMPESVTDRPTTAHEYIFLLAKQPRYYYDAEAVREQRKWEDPRIDASGMVRSVTDERSPYMAQARKTDKQRGHSRRHAGFNDRWDAMDKEEQGINGANLRDVWAIPTQGYPGAHFATFPEELPRRCILAGTSEHGVCAECGSPWVRVVDKGDLEKTGSSGNTRPSPVRDTNERNSRDENFRRSGVTQGLSYQNQTLGWQPTCECHAGRGPATVLDPFAGSGTTLAVAQALGRNAVGLDLNPEYLDLAIKRITNIPLPMQI